MFYILYVLEISIPHGTIKSPYVMETEHMGNISIPHGTIKSVYPVHDLFVVEQFQYLMVQLKAEKAA